MSRQTINTLFYFLFILKCAVICNFPHKRYYFILFITMKEYSILLQFLSLKFNCIRVSLKQFNLFLVFFSTALSVNYDKTKYTRYTPAPPHRLSTHLEMVYDTCRNANSPQRLLPLISTVTTATTSISGSREPDLFFHFYF